MTWSDPVRRPGSDARRRAPTGRLSFRRIHSLGPAYPMAIMAALALAGCTPEAPEPERAEATDAPEAADPTIQAPGTGYRVHLDGDLSAPGEFLVRGGSSGGAVRITTGPGGIAWRAEDTVSAGPFRVEATFLQRGAPVGYREAYGIFVGGDDLGGPGRRYTYLLVRGTGEFLVRRRTGDDTETLLEWTDHPAVAGVASEGAEPQNTLAVEADSLETRFLVNGAVVHRLGSQEVAPYGAAGLRVNHRLDLEVEGWALERLPAADVPPS